MLFISVLHTVFYIDSAIRSKCYCWVMRANCLSSYLPTKHVLVVFEKANWEFFLGTEKITLLFFTQTILQRSYNTGNNEEYLAFICSEFHWYRRSTSGMRVKQMNVFTIVKKDKDFICFHISHGRCISMV